MVSVLLSGKSFSLCAGKSGYCPVICSGAVQWKVEQVAEKKGLKSRFIVFRDRQLKVFAE